MSETHVSDEPVSEPLREGSEPVSGAVSEHVAARRLGLSVDTLRRDRRLGQLGIPFVKYGVGKRGVVRYDLADLERFIESRKRRAAPLPVVEIQAPVAPVAPVPVPIEPAEPEEPVARIDPLMTARRQYRSPWDAMTEAAMADEPEEDPFAAASRSPRHHGPGGYFSH
jgi:hypothetical protein